ncbi:hypothetical protein [Pseudanabaena sp. PCC 6802]|uniref:hypothetical protein n=1 Tax=Pseudanabaena sp. PCC 6802 TaxID=118173 RepID=UPI000368D57F|nr:hypothetical protein [Pseudanabaena sp. PCC 6802]
MTSTRSKNARLMIAVLPDEVSAFEAYRLLQNHGISPENLALVGRGFSSPESVGLLEPRRMAWRYAKQGIFLFTGLGVAAGIVVQLFLNLRFPSLNWYQTLLALSVATGAMGCLIGGTLGSMYGLFYKSSTSIACRNCLRQGQYLLLLEGSELLTRRGREILNMYTVKPNS